MRKCGAQEAAFTVINIHSVLSAGTRMGAEMGCSSEKPSLVSAYSDPPPPLQYKEILYKGGPCCLDMASESAAANWVTLLNNYFGFVFTKRRKKIQGEVLKIMNGKNMSENFRQF